MEKDKLKLLQRNTRLDLYRGLVMIYIVGIIHLLYWTDLISGIYKSLFLIEMPIIFFLTGATNSFNNKSLFSFYYSRIKKIFLPYLLYGLICSLLIYSLYFVKGTTVSLTNLIVEWVNPFAQRLSIGPLDYHIWFIPIYILCMLCFPIFKRLYQLLGERYNWVPLIVLALLILLLDLYIGLSNQYYTRCIIFYSIWMYLGLFYHRFNRQPLSKNVLIYCFISGCISLFLLVKYLNYTFDMQVNKIPPNFAFLMFCIANMSLVVLLKEYIIKITKFKFINHIVMFYSNNSYAIYLFHPFSYIIFLKFLKYCNYIYKYKLLSFILGFSFIVCFSVIYPMIGKKMKELIDYKKYSRLPKTIFH